MNVLTFFTSSTPPFKKNIQEKGGGRICTFLVDFSTFCVLVRFQRKTLIIWVEGQGLCVFLNQRKKELFNRPKKTNDYLLSDQVFILTYFSIRQVYNF